MGMKILRPNTSAGHRPRGPEPSLDHNKIVESAFEAARTGRSLRSVAEDYDCTSERIRQILKARNLFEAYRQAVEQTKADVKRFLSGRT